jgi:FkbM family methyltransferase
MCHLIVTSMISRLRKLVKSSARRLGLEVFAIRTMDRGISLDVDLLRLYARNPDQHATPLTLVDVGANIGQTAIWLAKIFPNATIHSFEPISTTFEQLVHNIRHHRRIKVNRTALGAEDGNARMEITANSGTNRILADQVPPNMKTERVTLARLDTYCQNNNVPIVDLLKTDCEGHDLDVLYGASSLLKQGLITAVYCEVNFLRDGRCADFFAMESYLRQFDMCFYALYNYSGWSYDVGAEGFCNALFVKRDFLRPPVAQAKRSSAMNNSGSKCW